MKINASGYFSCPECKEKYYTQLLTAICCHAFSPLKAARLDLGLTQTELSDKIGVSQSLLAQWEPGKKLPNKKSMAKIHKIIKIKSSDIYEFYLKG